jgi:CDP-glucose 4,6-dehydratase
MGPAGGGLTPGHWRDRRVLLTGATGLLGGWMLRRLLELEADPVCLVRDDVPRAYSVRSRDLSRAAVVRGDVTDAPLLERAVAEYEVRTVIHLAAQTIVGIAVRHPLSTFQTNIAGTWTVLEACRRAGPVEAIVVASSDKAYGQAASLPYDESFPLQGRHPYDVSKSCADLLAGSYHATYGLPVAITRCGNLYGGGDLNFNRVVPGTVRSALYGERPVVRSDGSPRRDYLYVEDAVEAYLGLAERTATDASIQGQAFNFSLEQPRTVLEMVRAVLTAAGRPDLEPVVENRAVHEIPDQFLSAAKARRVLGWTPAFTLDEGLRRTVAWYADYLKRPTGLELAS